MKYVDINADVGEGFDDALLMPYITSCNIACGGHVGDNESIKNTLEMARNFDVLAGIHPSFPDKVNFGRVRMEMTHTELVDQLISQLTNFTSIAKQMGYPVHHIKPHGALYNEAAKDTMIAQAVVEAILESGACHILYAPDHSELARIGSDRGLRILYEVFIDRQYTEDLRLVKRTHPNASIHLPEQAVRHVMRILLEKHVLTINGVEKPIRADTLCIHSDNPNALEILKALTSVLKNGNHEFSIKI